MELFEPARARASWLYRFLPAVIRLGDVGTLSLRYVDGVPQLVEHNSLIR